MGLFDKVIPWYYNIMPNKCNKSTICSLYGDRNKQFTYKLNEQGASLRNYRYSLVHDYFQIQPLHSQTIASIYSGFLIYFIESMLVLQKHMWSRLIGKEVLALQCTSPASSPLTFHKLVNRITNKLLLQHDVICIRDRNFILSASHGNLQMFYILWLIEIK